MAQDTLLKELVTEYARKGVEDWKRLPQDLQRAARKYLGNRIIDSEHQFWNQVPKETQDSFFPMPRRKEKKNLYCCFFRMRRKTSFELFVLVGCQNSLAFRFEPADEGASAHNYPHMQLCVRFQDLDPPPTGVPNWLPDSYPAFPLPASNPTKLFLAMLTSIHGRSGGVDEILREMFQQANKTAQWRECIAVLNEMLGAGT